MKKILFAAFAALSMIACNKDDATTVIPDIDNTLNGAIVAMRFTDETPTRAFFAEAAAAEAWEKSLSSLSVYVFNAKGDLITLRDFTASELTARTATFALPHATAGTTCDFYAVANMSLTGVTTKSAMLTKLQTSVAVQTSVDASFNSKYSGTLTVTGTKVVRAASQTPIIAPATPTPGAMTYTHTQAPAAASGKYNNLFYIFENGALAEASRVALEITATYDADGNASTTADRMEVVYTVPLTGKAGGEIARNGYYRVAANITGLVGQDCQVSVSVAEWETPVTESVDLGA